MKGKKRLTKIIDVSTTDNNQTQNDYSKIIFDSKGVSYLFINAYRDFFCNNSKVVEMCLIKPIYKYNMST